MSRTRSSPDYLAGTFANFGSKGTLEIIEFLVSLWFGSSLRSKLRNEANFRTATLVQRRPFADGTQIDQANHRGAVALGGGEFGGGFPCGAAVRAADHDAANHGRTPRSAASDRAGRGRARWPATERHPPPWRRVKRARICGSSRASPRAARSSARDARSQSADQRGRSRPCGDIIWRANSIAHPRWHSLDRSEPTQPPAPIAASQPNPAATRPAARSRAWAISGWPSG